MLLFVAQLAGFIAGAVWVYILSALGAWLGLGRPGGPDSGGPMLAPMLLAGAVGFSIGGFVGMRLAGNWVKAYLRQDTEPGNRDGGD